RSPQTCPGAHVDGSVRQPGKSGDLGEGSTSEVPCDERPCQHAGRPGTDYRRVVLGRQPEPAQLQSMLLIVVEPETAANAEALKRLVISVAASQEHRGSRLAQGARGEHVGRTRRRQWRHVVLP